MKLCSRKIARGSAKIEWEIQIVQNVPASPSLTYSEQQRDQRDLDGHDLQGEDQDEEEVAALEVDPGEGVGRQRGDRDRDEHRRDDDDDRVDEVGPERRSARLRREDVVIVAQRERRVDEDVPPAVRGDVRLRPERRDEQTEGGDRPQDRDDDGGDRGHGRGRSLLDPLGAEGNATRRRGRHGGVDGGHRDSDSRSCRTL